MLEDRVNLEEYASLSCAFQSIREVILRKHDFRLILEYRMILQKKV